MTESETKNRSSHLFELTLIFSQISAIAMVASGGFIFCTYDGGLQFDGLFDPARNNNTKNANNHGLLMSLGGVFLRGEALLAFRLFRHEPQQVALVVHFIFYLLSLLIPAGGLYSIYLHNQFDAIHLDGAHSFFGAALIIANLVHLISGFYAWISTNETRQIIIPKQRIFTLGLFLSTIAHLIGGVAQFDQIAFSKCTPKCPIHEEILLNIFPVFLIAYAIFVVLLLKNEDWKGTELDKMIKNK